MIIWAALGAGGLSFLIAALATPLSKSVAHRLGMLDIPERHKAHAKPVPLLGGSAIFAAILGPSLLALALARIWAAQGPPRWLPETLKLHISGAAGKSTMALGILAAAAFLHVIGLIDDRKHLGAWMKLIAQAAAAAFVVIFCDVRILTVAGPTASISASIIWLVTITNAFNFMDNMDGLAAGVAVICAAAILAASATMGQVFVTAWLCLILGAIAGFLPYSFPPASSFMGDAGSLVIGFLLGVLSCLTTYVGPGQTYYLYGVFVPLVVMAVPLYDTVGVILLRLRERRNPMVGDRRHFSHRLVRRGMSTRTAVLTIYLCTAGTAIAASLLPRVDTAGAVLVFAQSAIILLIVALLETGGTRA
ncbi:MAG: MraY family glycosyltransferase [Planctomycetota bacterium]|jgi:UDP-GlcNAc:undecaprenyl-phosphate GlcNAc-1-phosphate transferase